MQTFTGKQVFAVGVSFLMQSMHLHQKDTAGCKWLACRLLYRRCDIILYYTYIDYTVSMAWLQ